MPNPEHFSVSIHYDQPVIADVVARGFTHEELMKFIAIMGEEIEILEMSTANTVKRIALNVVVAIKEGREERAYNAWPNLGVLQEIWDAWDVEDAEIKKQTFGHFLQLYKEQLKELEEHRQNNNEVGVLREAVDFMSVSLNLFRWYGLKPDNIVRAIHNRVETRYKGKVKEIMNRDRGRFGM